MRQWLADKLVSLALFVSGDPPLPLVKKTNVKAAPHSDEDASVPYPPVALTKKAAKMLQDGARPSEFATETAPQQADILEGSAEDRMRKALARARTEMGS